MMNAPADRQSGRSQSTLAHIGLTLQAGYAWFDYYVCGSAMMNAYDLAAREMCTLTRVASLTRPIRSLIESMGINVPKTYAGVN